VVTEKREKRISLAKTTETAGVAVGENAFFTAEQWFPKMRLPVQWQVVLHQSIGTKRENEFK
jgi:hypothetical protein